MVRRPQARDIRRLRIPRLQGGSYWLISDSNDGSYGIVNDPRKLALRAMVELDRRIRQRHPNTHELISSQEAALARRITLPNFCDNLDLSPMTYCRRRRAWQIIT